jgi:hypothetical protein
MNKSTLEPITWISTSKLMAAAVVAIKNGVTARFG